MHKALCFSSLGPFSACVTYTQSQTRRQMGTKISLEYSTMTNETAQQTKAFVNKPGNLSSVLGSHILEGKS